MEATGFMRDGYVRARLSVSIPRRHLGWGYWFVEQGRTPLVTLVRKWECANGSEPEPVFRFRIMYPLAQR